MSNTQKRHDFFHDISSALGRGNIPDHVDPLDLSAGPQHKLMAGLSHGELVDAFKNECNNLAIKFRETEKEDLADSLMAVIREYGGGKIIYPKVKEISDFHIDRAFEQNQGKDGLAAADPYCCVAPQHHYAPYDPDHGRACRTLP